MGLKCSVLGHAYGETTVERDREERGSEVVITIRELETCDRCGDTRVVTENKEVTTIETQDDRPDVTAEDAMAAMDAGGDDHTGNDHAGGTEAPGRTDAGTEAAGDDVGASAGADANDDAGGDGSIVDDAEGGVAVGDESSGSPSPDTVEDQGAEILDAENDADDGAVDDELADPTIENDADVPGDSADDEDAVILEDDPAAGTGPSGGAESSAGADAADATATDDPEDGPEGTDEPGPFEPPADDDDDDDPLGEWPEETLRDDEDWAPSTDLTGTVDDVDPDDDFDREISNSAVTVPEGEFHCQECGYTTDVEATSLRAGDFCPECRTGTLHHRPEE